MSGALLPPGALKEPSSTSAPATQPRLISVRRVWAKPCLAQSALPNLGSLTTALFSPPKPRPHTTSIMSKAGRHGWEDVQGAMSAAGMSEQQQLALIGRMVIWSDDHEWAQALPLSDNVLVCQRCTYRRAMKAANAQRCIPHGELATSGWTDMQTGKHWDGTQWVESPP